ncbi:MAG: M61 family metallopeptidase, partial [Bacteroidia bacterium]
LCLYVPERINEKYTLELKIPSDYKVATSLSQQKNILTATDYHELADSPFIASAGLKHFSYEVAGITFNIWIKGECNPDKQKIIQDFAAYSKTQIEMFGGAPFTEYHFLYQILPYRVYHGVEHLSSTVIALGPGHNLMKPEVYEDFLGVSSHELFHAWNVKAVRPVEMKPYKYELENYNRLGFVTEGVTTYYGDLHLLRSKVFNPDEYFKDLVKNVQKHFDNYGRFNLSVADSSYDTWLDGYSEGIPNRKSSIYTEGCLCAFMLDILIMKQTNNLRSLDDVMRRLFEQYAANGYSEQDYKNIAEEFAGISLDNFFNSFIYGVSDYEPLLIHSLGYIGCTLTSIHAPTYRERFFGIKSVNENGKAKIRSVAPGSPAFFADLTRDDEIITVNGIKVDNNFSDLLESRGDQEIEINYFSLGQLKKTTLKKTKEEFYPLYFIKKSDKVSQEQKEDFNMWAYRVNL